MNTVFYASSYLLPSPSWRKPINREIDLFGTGKSEYIFLEICFENSHALFNKMPPRHKQISMANKIQSRCRK